jgi:TPR repeat protein/class 3 adenylate cyclase
MRCQSCGLENSAECQVCAGCGKALARECPECGASNQPNADVCRVCGKNLEGAPARSVPLITPTAPDLVAQAAPDGTVSILFSDIENSTVMTERLGDLRAQEVLHAHNAIIRREIAGQRGFEVKSMGDGFMVAFSSGRRALLCAIGIQRAFADYCSEHPDQPIRVRIGLHTGEAIREAGDFFGRAVIMAARIGALAQAGEILVSSTFKEVTESGGDFRFDAGREVHLKGLSGSYRVYTAIWSGSGSVTAVARNASPTRRWRRPRITLARAALAIVLAAAMTFIGYQQLGLTAKGRSQNSLAGNSGNDRSGGPGLERAATESTAIGTQGEAAATRAQEPIGQEPIGEDTLSPHLGERLALSTDRFGQDRSPSGAAVTPQALEQYRTAAARGDATAQAHLGFMYFRGFGVPQDYTQALQWFRKAAEQNNPAAEDGLGTIYAHGIGVPQDYGQALAWYRKAAAQDNADAQDSLGLMNLHGTGLPADDVRALQWFRRSANQGYAQAETNLGSMYQRGLGVPRDYDKALEWYRKAAAQGSARAQDGIGRMYEFGLGVPQDFAQALAHYRLAAAQNNPVGEFNLGRLYEFGRGVPKDPATAARWYQLAAAHGNEAASQRLAALNTR